MKENNKKPLISVLIPTYNYGRFLEEAIDSVLAQTIEDFEILIMDNASTDNTREVVKKYTDKYSFIKFYENDSNIGGNRNWNKLLYVAEGKYIKYLCADDKLKPDCLKKFVAIMEADDSIQVVSSVSERYLSEDGTIITTEQHLPPMYGKIQGTEAILSVMNTRNWIGGPTFTMIRTEKARRAGGFHEGLFYLADIEFWFRLLKDGYLYMYESSFTYSRRHASQDLKILGNNAVSDMQMYTLVSFYHNTDILGKPLDDVLYKRAKILHNTYKHTIFTSENVKKNIERIISLYDFKEKKGLVRKILNK